MPWYRLAFQPDTAQDLAVIDQSMAQRLLDKCKWLVSNVDNLRHEPIADDLPGLCKYAVGEWRIFYTMTAQISSSTSTRSFHDQD
ncbi:MAG: hypothetical protein HC938_07620 [Nitrospira sp.]|nr:hypothetical protein [Nitrospira sp.]